MKGSIALALLLIGSVVRAGDPQLALDLPPDVRVWCSNPDGSCVQCSIQMCGLDQNVTAAATLLFRSEYGKAERGGGTAGRTASYSASRGMAIYNITGPDTYAWMAWACANGRGCAIGCGSSHFQTLVGHDPVTKTWWVCNNNSTRKIDEYTDASFRRKHEASGRWIVILDYPSAPAKPQYVNWWD